MTDPGASRSRHRAHKLLARRASAGGHFPKLPRRAITTAFVLLIGSTPGAAAPAKIAIMPVDAAARRDQEAWGYADAVISGDVVYLSGVVAARKPAESTEAAFERAFATIGAILQRAGSSWNDVVDITSYHTDVGEQIEAMVAVKSRYVKAPFPAWTAIGVARLIPSDGIAEIKVIARKTAKNHSGTPKLRK